MITIYNNSLNINIHVINCWIIVSYFCHYYIWLHTTIKFLFVCFVLLLLLLFSLFHVFPSLLIFPVFFFLSDFPTRKVIHEKTSSCQVSFFVLCFMHVYYYYDYYYFDGRFKLFERYFNIKFHVILLWIYLFFFHSY